MSNSTLVIDSQLRELKQQISERKTPRSITLLKRVFLILMGVVFSLSLVTAILQSRENADYNVYLVQAIKGSQRLYEFTSLQINLRSLLSLANNIVATHNITL